MAVIKIGTRESALAVAQAHEIKRAIIASGIEDKIEIITLKTSGDKFLEKNLSAIGGKGLFTKEIEEALIAKEIDLAVHSMKDVPAYLPVGLVIKAMLPRRDPTDCFLSKKYNNFTELPKGSIIGTSSLRRKAIILNHRPDLNIINFRGNINTRLQKLSDGKADAIILATSGLERINKADLITEKFTFDMMLPAVGQGAIGVECRECDDNMLHILDKINHKETQICVNAEREFMIQIDGSCKTPMAAYATLNNDEINLQSLVVHPLGTSKYKLSGKVELGRERELAISFADKTKANAGDILEFIKDYII